VSTQTTSGTQLQPPRAGVPVDHSHRSVSAAPFLRALSPKNIGAIYVLGLICVVFSVWVPDTFPQMATVRQVINGSAITAMAALALIVPLATKTFDLSFAYAMSLSGVTAAHFIVQNDLGVVPAMILGLLAALVIGLINAIVVVVMQIDSFIGTLATGSLVLAFITYFTHDVSINDIRLAEGFSKLGQSQVNGFNYPVVYAVLLAFGLWFLLEHTPTGRRLYATGFNPDAARLAGIHVERLRFISLLVSSGVAGIAGLCLASTLSAGSPTAGSSYLLPAYAAAFVGATQFKRGRFNAWGTLVAVVMLGSGTVGLGLANAEPWAANMFTGVVLIGALSVTGAQRRLVRAGRFRRRGVLEPRPEETTATP
jgi:ribose transport system permease protein